MLHFTGDVNLPMLPVNYMFDITFCVIMITTFSLDLNEYERKMEILFVDMCLSFSSM